MRGAPRARALTPVVLFVLGALLSGVTIRWGINPHDEGLVLQAGARISEGQLPYRDFYANYGPGQYFLAGGLDLLFGPSLLSWRVRARGARRDASACSPTSSPAAQAPEPLRSGAWLAVAGAMAFPSIPSPNPAAIALGLGALLLAGRRPAPAGALAGFAVVFRVDVGVAAVAGAVLAAFPTGGRRAARPRRGWPRRSSPWCCWPRSCSPTRATPGTRRSASRWTSRVCSACRCPDLDPGTLQPNKVLDHLFPYVLLAGAALWAALAARVARAAARLGGGPAPAVGRRLHPGPRRRVPLHPRWPPCCPCCS